MRDINFIGNVEARDIFQGGVDVLVCDGFIGNVMLKTAQGTVNMMMQMLKNMLSSHCLIVFYLLVVVHCCKS